MKGRWLGGFRRLRRDELRRGKGPCRVMGGLSGGILEIENKISWLIYKILPLLALVLGTGFHFVLSNVMNFVDLSEVAAGDS